jgi:hypothetical protein
MIVRVALLASLLLLLTACVAFEHAPVEALQCDPALAGRWESTRGEPHKHDIVVTAACDMQWPENDGAVYSTTLRGFELEGAHYLVFTPEAVSRLMSMDDALIRQAPEGSVLLARYRVDSNEVVLWIADAEMMLQGIAAKKLAGRKIGDKVAYLEGSHDEVATLLRNSGDTIFRSDKDGVLHFRRSTTEGTP